MKSYVKGFLYGIVFLFFCWLGYKGAWLYLDFARKLSANVFRPKDVIGPYGIALVAAIIATILTIWFFEALAEERAKKKREEEYIAKLREDAAKRMVAEEGRAVRNYQNKMRQVEARMDRFRREYR